MHELAGRLTVLAVGQCGMRDSALDALAGAGLVRLRTLDLSENQLLGMEALEEVVRSLQSLEKLDLRGNPVTRTPK